LFPEGSRPEDRVTVASSLCSYYGRRLQITGMFRQLLCQHFGDTENIAEVKLRTKLRSLGPWSDSDSSGMLIETNSRWTPNAEEQRPAIIIKPNAWRWKRETIGGFGGEDEETGADNMMGFWYGSHTLFAITRKGAETEILAAEVSRLLEHYQKTLVEDFELHKAVPLELGEPAKIKESADHWAVPISLAYVIESTHEIIPHSPRLKKIRFSTTDFG
jgi:hypothetical protein